MLKARGEVRKKERRRKKEDMEVIFRFGIQQRKFWVNEEGFNGKKGAI